MALTSGIAARPQPTLPAALATVLAPLLNAPAKPAANTGPGVSYVPSIPPAAAPLPVTTPVATPAPAPTVPDVSDAPSLPLPATVTPPASVAIPAEPAAAAPPTLEVSYAPSLIAPASIVPAAIPETIVALAPSPVAAAVTPILLPSEPAAPPPRDEVAEPVAVAPAQGTPPSAATPSASTTTSRPAAQPSLLDLYRDATRTTEAHALTGFALFEPTVAVTPTSPVRTGAELIADAAYTLVAGAGTNRAGIAMLLDSTGAQASEEGNRRTPEAKKPSALAA